MSHGARHLTQGTTVVEIPITWHQSEEESIGVVHDDLQPHGKVAEGGRQQDNWSLSRQTCVGTRIEHGTMQLRRSK
ncbi:hypothetical protein MRX96_001282 [Rhipicephalus microplus]